MTSSASPAEQIRAALTVSKRQGISFDAAWKYAYGNLKGPHDTYHRREWRVVLADLRWAFERAYLDEDVPGGPALLRLAEALSMVGESDRDIPPVRTPPDAFDAKNTGNPMGIPFIASEYRDVA